MDGDQKPNVPAIPIDPATRARTSRERYRGFVRDYLERKLDQKAEEHDDPSSAEARKGRRAHRKEYLREYARWLWPHRYHVASVFLLALLVAGLQMVEPLFMR